MSHVAATSTALGPYLPFILKGFLVTLKVFAIGTVVWIPVAFILAFARMSRFRLLRLGGGFIVETFRGTSALVQLFWAFYALPLLGVRLSPMLSAILVLGLNEGSYASEIVRGAIRAVPRGQSEAATALGLSAWRRFRHVILPQALAVMIPPFGNTAIDFLKFTSFVSLVTVSDVTLRAQQVRETVGHTSVVFALLLVMFFATSLVIAQVMRELERYLRRRRGEPVPRRRLLPRITRLYATTQIGPKP
jgi:polar amino acid transport system permease protein